MLSDSIKMVEQISVVKVTQSSYQVFMSFVETNDEGEKNVDKVFSKECFNHWLSTRIKSPKQPSESFRRALTSHVRGTDQRKYVFVLFVF